VAEGHTAVHAARALSLELRLIDRRVDLLEVLGAFGDRLQRSASGVSIRTFEKHKSPYKARF
jgi:hypothetical protein